MWASEPRLVRLGNERNGADMRRQMNELSLPPRPRPKHLLCPPPFLFSEVSGFKRRIFFLPSLSPKASEAVKEEADETANANRLFAQRRTEKGVTRGSGSGKRNVWH